MQKKLWSLCFFYFWSFHLIPQTQSQPRNHQTSSGPTPSACFKVVISFSPCRRREDTTEILSLSFQLWEQVSWMSENSSFCPMARRNSASKLQFSMLFPPWEVYSRWLSWALGLLFLGIFYYLSIHVSLSSKVPGMGNMAWHCPIFRTNPGPALSEKQPGWDGFSCLSMTTSSIWYKYTTNSKVSLALSGVNLIKIFPFLSYFMVFIVI